MGKIGSFFNIEVQKVRPNFSGNLYKTQFGEPVYFQRPVTEEDIYIMDPLTDSFIGRPNYEVIYPTLCYVIMGYNYFNFRNACIMPIPEHEKGDRLRDVGLFCAK